MHRCERPRALEGFAWPSPVERPLSVRIASFATKCQTRLTRDEYKAKRKRLQAALDSGALTQKEFDKYDADLVSCLQ